MPPLLAHTAAAPSDSGSKDHNDTEDSSVLRSTFRKTKAVLARHANFVGPGIVASVAYADPGNWATDLEAGASHGYKLLFAVLISGLFAILLQVLACRLGIVTGLDLACSSRQLILGPFGTHPSAGGGLGNSDEALRRPRWEKWVRYGGLWAIYLIAEAAIVATELAELVGSAIALNLLFPKLPLWGGVLVTGADVFLILFVYRPNGGLRAFEILISILVIIVLACYIVLLVRVKPDWGEAFKGYLPSSTLIQHDALYIAVGILGATVMPHGLFLGSHFSTVNRLEKYDEDDGDASIATAAAAASSSSLQELPRASAAADDSRAGLFGGPAASAPKTVRDRAFQLLVRLFPRIDASAFEPGLARASLHPSDTAAVGKGGSGGGGGGYRGPRIPDMMDPDKPPVVSLAMVRTHLPHASTDIALSLLAFAITINSAILIVAAAATSTGEREVSSLFEAFDLLRDTVGRGAAVLFAVALLAAGQSASLTVCLAGQIISEGFIRWRTSPLMRRVLTRVIAMVPSLIVAAAVGKDGVDALLIGSQVVLSMALPFVTAPLLIMTCRKKWMRVWEDAPRSSTNTGTDTTAVLRSSMSASGAVVDATSATAPPETPGSTKAAAQEPACMTTTGASPADSSQVELESGGKWYFFQNWWPVAILAWAVFGVICVADVFTLVTL